LVGQLLRGIRVFDRRFVVWLMGGRFRLAFVLVFVALPGRVGVVDGVFDALAVGRRVLFRLLAGGIRFRRACAVLVRIRFVFSRFRRFRRSSSIGV
jgi:hypothetical protein